MGKALKLVILTFTLLTFCAGNAALAQTILLDKFELGSLRIADPLSTDPNIHYIWNQYTNDFYAGPDPGLASIVSTDKHDGISSANVHVTGGNVYFQFYPNDGVSWHFMREYTQPSASWTLNTFNRMRFWVKIPSSMSKSPAGQCNVQLGTYLRKSNGDPQSQNDGGMHAYHLYNFKYTGAWEQVIFDSHPTYIIGAEGNGNTEFGNQPYPTGESGFNYFDALTRFYFDGQGGLSSYPADFLFDGFELYNDPNPENLDQIYSLHGVYVLGTNEIFVGWNRNKDENTVNHEVRYAFQDIFSIGWNTATPAPNGIVTPPDFQGYNGMEWSTTSINVSSQAVIYIAIKPQNSSRFRQIAISLSSSGSPPGLTPPATPENLNVSSLFGPPLFPTPLTLGFLSGGYWRLVS